MVFTARDEFSNEREYLLEIKIIDRLKDGICGL